MVLTAKLTTNKEKLHRITKNNPSQNKLTLEKHANTPRQKPKPSGPHSLCTIVVSVD